MLENKSNKISALGWDTQVEHLLNEEKKNENLTALMVIR